MNVSLFLEIKEEYTRHLIDTLTPFIYEGLTSIYKKAVDSAHQSGEETKTLLVFQKMLQTVNGWSQQRIDDETNRIKVQSNTSTYLDDLVKAVIKSNIILLSYSNTISNMIGPAFYDNFTTGMFIHRCYTECAKDSHNNPYLFYHDVSPMDVKRNQIIIQQNIENSIVKAIRKVLPISMILKEYLINSVNIINSPAKVELIGAAGAPIGIPPPVVPPVKEERLDPLVEEKIMAAVASDHQKTDQEKIKAMMNMEKIITSMTPKRNYSPISSLPERHSINETDNVINRHLHSSDQLLMDINFDKTHSSNNPGRSHTSNLSISMMPMANAKKKQMPLTSEINPSEAEFIEEYGGNRKRTNYRK
jgi:hypothetical protein